MIVTTRMNVHLLTILKQFKVFSLLEHPACLYNIATKDLVTEEIQVSLSNAKELGRQQMKEVVEQRFPSVSQQQRDRSSESRVWDTMHKNNAPTIDNLYQVVKSSKEKNKTTILRADRNVLQLLIIAYEAGRKVDHRAECAEI